MIQNGSNSGKNNGSNGPLSEYQWKKGQSGNPAGRPKVDSVTKAIRKLLNEGLNGEPLYEAIARVAIQKALRGDKAFWQFVVERMDGKVADQMHQSGQVEVIVKYEDDPLRME